IDDDRRLARLRIREVELAGIGRRDRCRIHPVVITGEVYHPRVVAARQTDAGPAVAERDVVDERRTHRVLIHDESTTVRVLLSVQVLDRNTALDDVILRRPLHRVQLDAARPRVGGATAIVRGDTLPYLDVARAVHGKRRSPVTITDAVDVLEVAVRIGRSLTRPTIGEAAIPMARHDADEAQILTGIGRDTTGFVPLLVVHECFAGPFDDGQRTFIRLESDPGVGSTRVLRVKRLVIR